MPVTRIIAASLIAIFTISCALAGTLSAVETNTLRWQVSRISLKRGKAKNDAPVVTGISVHPTEHECALVGDDHLVRIYSTDTERQLATLEAHDDWVRCVKFDHEGEQLFSAGNDRKIVLWTRADNGDYSHKTFVEESRATTGMAVSYDNRYLATVGFSNELNVYEIESGNRVLQVVCPCADMRSVTFSPVENIVAAGGRSGEVRMWDLDTGRTVRDFKPHTQRIRGLQFSRDGEDLISCSEDRTIAIMRVNKAIEPIRRTGKQGYKLMSLSIVDTDRFAVGGTNNEVIIWNIADLTRGGRLGGHTGTVAAVDCGGTHLVSGGYDTEIRVWNWNPTVADGSGKPSPSHPKTQFSGFKSR